jgi:hypothetical protein
LKEGDNMTVYDLTDLHDLFDGRDVYLLIRAKNEEVLKELYDMIDEAFKEGELSSLDFKIYLVTTEEV